MNTLFYFFYSYFRPQSFQETWPLIIMRSSAIKPATLVRQKKTLDSNSALKSPSDSHGKLICNVDWFKNCGLVEKKEQLHSWNTKKSNSYFMFVCCTTNRNETEWSKLFYEPHSEVDFLTEIHHFREDVTDSKKFSNVFKTNIFDYDK